MQRQGNPLQGCTLSQIYALNSGPWLAHEPETPMRRKGDNLVPELESRLEVLGLISDLKATPDISPAGPVNSRMAKLHTVSQSARQ